jgi:hypothetical protein
MPGLVLWMVGIFAAASGMVIAWLFARIVPRGERRRRASRVGIVLPWACLAWIGVVLTSKQIVDARIYHRPPSAEDAWECVLANGYELSMIDELDYAVLAPKNVSDFDEAGRVVDVRVAQVNGAYVAAGADTRDFEERKKPAPLDSFVLIDTRTRSIRRFRSEEALRGAARPSFELKLEPVRMIYGRYCTTAFDDVVPGLLLFPLIVGVAIFIAWLFHLRYQSTRATA